MLGILFFFLHVSCVYACVYFCMCVAYVLLHVELPWLMSGLSLHLSLTKFNKVGPLS